MINWQDDQAVAYLYQQIMQEVDEKIKAAIEAAMTGENAAK